MNRAVIGMLAAVSVGATVSLAQQAAPQPPAQKSWTDSVTLKGDLRYRYETINDDSKLNADKDTFTRQRDRLRARLGAEAKGNDHTKVGIELSTGESDPVSGNQTIGDGLIKKDMKLNLAYVDYNFMDDTDANELHLIGGKMKNPFINVSDLIWDGDLTPEGVGLRSQWAAGPATLMANGGYLWMQERDKDSDDTMLLAAQPAVKLQFMPEVSLTLGATLYSYDNMEGYDVIDWQKKNGAYGNSTAKGKVVGSVTNKVYANEFEQTEFFAQLDIWLGLPLGLYAQTVSNSEAEQNDTGFLYGLGVGKAKNPGTFEVGASYGELEKDAVVGAFTDSDRWGGGTDGKGYKLYGKYQIMKNLQCGISYFTDDRIISDSAKTTDYERMQVDLVAAF